MVKICSQTAANSTKLPHPIQGQPNHNIYFPYVVPQVLDDIYNEISWTSRITIYILYRSVWYYLFQFVAKFCFLRKNLDRQFYCCNWQSEGHQGFHFSENWINQSYAIRREISQLGPCFPSLAGGDGDGYQVRCITVSGGWEVNCLSAVTSQAGLVCQVWPGEREERQQDPRLHH